MGHIDRRRIGDGMRRMWGDRARRQGDGMLGPGNGGIRRQGNGRLGTNAIGRDLLTRLIYGAQASMFVAFLVVTIATSAALVLGLTSGYFGGWLGAFIDRCMDALFTFPPLTLALAIAALLGASLTNASFAIAVVFVPGLVRVIRSQVLAVREETFIEAARSVGATDGRMLRRHVLPNVFAPILVIVSSLSAIALGLPGLTMKNALIAGSSSFLRSASSNWKRFSCRAGIGTILRS